VWYFGEDVLNYHRGRVKDTEGSWLAGPPGMIMPARPRVGDVYHSENIPGLVLEQDTVKRAGVAVRGPRGRVDGAIAIEEQLMDGTREHKLFAPGYGEFRAEAADELVRVALAVPIDRPRGPEPRPLAALERALTTAWEHARARDPGAVRAATVSAGDAWRTLRRGTDAPLLRAAMDRTLGALRRAAARRDPRQAELAALDASEAALDLALRYRPSAVVDRARVARLGRRLLTDQAADDSGGVAGDIAAIDAIRARTP
jgi:hypothetical protein